MFSFLNGKSPFDEAEERLEAGDTVNGKPRLPSGPIMGWQDGVFLLVIIGLIVGGYHYYQYVKRNCAETFAKCDALYAAAAEDASKFAEVESCYEATWDLAFVSDTLEVLRQNRLGEIEDMRNVQKDLLTSANDALDKGDTAAAAKIVTEYKGAMLLYTGDKSEWDEIVKIAEVQAAKEAAKVAAAAAAEPVADTAAAKK
ncbi:hypothetical protein [Fibrobacter sp. UWB5]|uniref:hypothetical protein n=1 Tax=Fibrobacter sp. UWB5 TaxID=1964360 RepID=UPI000B5225A2|nr:hypothetical protein [Fibrobacter sp. UWB5]OWV11842.1 hypothetical protein B7989_09435 [Fibrobacter sp. UWB5]